MKENLGVRIRKALLLAPMTIDDLSVSLSERRGTVEAAIARLRSHRLVTPAATARVKRTGRLRIVWRRA